MFKKYFETKEGTNIKDFSKLKEKFNAFFEEKLNILGYSDISEINEDIVEELFNSAKQEWLEIMTQLKKI
jgi:hypothetical protein